MTETKFNNPEKSTQFAHLVTWDNSQFTIKMTWCFAGGFWRMEIFNKYKLLVRSGISLVAGRDLLEGFRTNKTPTQKLFLSESSDGSTLGFDNISEFSLIYG